MLIYDILSSIWLRYPSHEPVVMYNAERTYLDVAPFYL